MEDKEVGKLRFNKIAEYYVNPLSDQASLVPSVTIFDEAGTQGKQ